MTPEKILYTAQMTSTGGRDGSSNRSDGSFPLTLTVPKGLGGPGGEGTNPEELFAAGYSACFIGALKVAGRHAKIKIPDDVRVTAKVGVGQIEGGYALSAELIVALPDMERDTAVGLVEQAHAICPYSNATRGNLDVKLTVL